MPGADNALGFAGDWEDAKGELVGIEGTKLSYPDGSILDLVVVTRSKCAFKVGSKVCQGTLSDDKSKLVWNDGTIWIRKSVPILALGSQGPVQAIKPKKSIKELQRNYQFANSRTNERSAHPGNYMAGPVELGLPNPGGPGHEVRIEQGMDDVQYDGDVEQPEDHMTMAVEPESGAAETSPDPEENNIADEEQNESNDPLELLVLSRKHKRDGRGDKALRAATNAVAIFRENGDVVGEVDAVHAVITGMVANGEVEQALKLGTEALTRVRMSNEPSLAALRRMEAPIMLAIAEVQVAKKNPEKALESAKKAKSFFQGVGDKRWTAEVHLTTASAHLLAKDFEAAVKSAESAKRLFEEIGAKEGQAIALHTIVDVHLKGSKYPDARHAAEAARMLFHNMGDVRMEACMLHLIAQAHLLSHNSQHALDAATQAVEHYRAAGTRKEEAIAMMSVVRAHLAGGAPSYAAGLAEDVLSVFRELGEEKLEADMQLEVARMHKELGQAENAMESALVAQTIYMELDDQDGKKAVNELLCLLELLPDMKDRALGLVEQLAQAMKERDGIAFKRLLQAVNREERAGSILAEDVDDALQPVMKQDPKGTEEFIRANVDWLGGEAPSSLAPGLFDKKVRRPIKLDRGNRTFGARGLFDG